MVDHYKLRKYPSQPPNPAFCGADDKIRLEGLENFISSSEVCLAGCIKPPFC